MIIKTVKSFKLNEKNVLLRVDFNVPVIDGIITDASRIEAVKETLDYLVKQNSKIIILSHMGRPKNFDEKFSLKITAEKLKEIMGMEVHFFNNPFENGVKDKISSLPFPSIIMFENLRFFEGEKKDDKEFAEKLKSFSKIYINDAFAVSHRKNASVHALPLMIKEKGMGFLMNREIENLNKALKNPVRPCVFIIGGAKVSTKLGIINNILNFADTIMIGGGIAFTFLKTFGFNIGKSIVEEDMLEQCREIFKTAQEKNVNIILPVDFKVAKSIEGDEIRIIDRNDFTPSDIGLDIGPLSIEIFSAAVLSAKTIVWNGPMGLFENPEFIEGTQQIANAVSNATDNGSFTIIGGGDSISAINQLGKADRVSFISTGGGAMLEYLSGLKLPGIEVLKEEQ